MERFNSVGEFMDLDLLDHLGDAMLLNDKLLFLGIGNTQHYMHFQGYKYLFGELAIWPTTS